ncbi:kynureninase [Methylobacter sp.]|jgi:kynureninase|uniref:kynureninase n=1 Tax=Methylobacter sp. TaxID=2051955 RepID=UPI003DA61359
MITDVAWREIDSPVNTVDSKSLFNLPLGRDGKSAAYFCGHSLGPAPKAAAGFVAQELLRWAELGVNGHFVGAVPWVDVTAPLIAPLAQLAGAQPDEVVVMNALTVNLHLLLTSFLQPRGRRNRVLISKSAFPSDRLAIVSQLRLRGLDPAACLLEVDAAPIRGRTLADAVVETIDQEGERLALAWVEAVDFCSGEVVDIERVAQAAHRVGALAGFDLAHAIGNIPLALDRAEADFAVWCSYKYLNAGPGAIGGCYVNRRFHGDDSLPRLSGWWGLDPASRFRFDPSRLCSAKSAAAWQLSNPPVLEAAVLRASMEIFARHSMIDLRARSLELTAAARSAIDSIGAKHLQVITPAEASRRASQLSLRIPGRASELVNALQGHDVVCDARGEDILRLSLAPLYNNEDDIAEMVKALEAVL